MTDLLFMRLILTVDVADQRVIGLRRKVPYLKIQEMIREIAEYCTKQGITIIGPPAYICHETRQETAKQAAETGDSVREVVFPIEGEAEASGDLSVYEIPGGKMARIIHMGPYRDRHDTYQELFAWLAKNDLELNGPVREVYINDPAVTDEDILVTWIYAPISDTGSTGEPSARAWK